MNAMQHHKMIVSSGNQPTIEPYSDAAIRVATPLDAIMMLERAEAGRRIATVILAGTYARDRELAHFLGTFYPAVQIESEA